LTAKEIERARVQRDLHERRRHADDPSRAGPSPFKVAAAVCSPSESLSRVAPPTNWYAISHPPAEFE
jgi:hypothetical protein